MAATEVSEEGLEQMLRSLLANWEVETAQLEGKRGTTELQMVAVFSLAAHAHRLASAVLVLRSTKLFLESIPLTREAFQFALTAHWLTVWPSAVDGFIAESERQHNLTLSSVIKAGWEALAEREEAPAKTKDFTAQSARNFHQLCNDLTPAGQEAYAMYRILSSYTHPGYRVIDQYLAGEPIRGHTYPVKFTQDDARPWLFITCCCVIWAARAVDRLTLRQERRGELRSAAKRLGIKAELQLSEDFKVRERKARRGNWKNQAD
ncbi:hypothetical protein [Actinokineospora fastidiosa]|uniref:Uncharacterized protein n=1 Tax=Actinokineospora fastidiosa TaxID=1816 RepID=A0A918LBL7_9PSEU|nr:hypothetical protein [Actinokineospora fastidiosa]GGS28290.1 hypothetical protein GCM10010171_21580 [Actinokineospora fastidiosa]